MSLNREEIAADLVWRYVEHLRGSQEENPGAAALSVEELRQLVETMTLAGELSQAMGSSETAEDRKAAVLRRLEARVAAPTAASPRTSPASASWLAGFTAGGPVPLWKFRAALGAALAFALALVVMVPSLSSQRAASTVVKRVRVPVEASDIDIQPVEEALVHDLLPRMVRNELPPKQERNLMWHMLVCRGCFDEYVELKHHRTMNDAPTATLASFRQ